MHDIRRTGLLAALVLSAMPAAARARVGPSSPQCAIDGLYQVIQGGNWFTRFDGQGFWATYTSRPGGTAYVAPTNQGRFTLRGEVLSFDDAPTRCSANSAHYTVRFSEDCQTLSLILREDTCHLVQRQDIVFRRVQ